MGLGLAYAKLFLEGKKPERKENVSNKEREREISKTFSAVNFTFAYS